MCVEVSPNVRKSAEFRAMQRRRGVLVFVLRGLVFFGWRILRGFILFGGHIFGSVSSVVAWGDGAASVFNKASICDFLCQSSAASDTVFVCTSERLWCLLFVIWLCGAVMFGCQKLQGFGLGWCL